MSDQVKTELKEALLKIKDKVRVTKIVCTRSVKGRNGDNYVGFSAAWDTIQDDAGGAADQITIMDDKDVVTSFKQGLSLKESRLASLVLGMQVDIAAHEQALAGGGITPEQRNVAVRAIRHNYGKLMSDMFANDNATATTATSVEGESSNG
jgi:hypothetical protein